MGKFSDALAKGRKSAKEEKEKKSHQGNADTARRLAGVPCIIALWLAYIDVDLESVMERETNDEERRDTDHPNRL